jgi:Asp-tRNA(Asn)/Glu-tRNA(Gln) amidotransferase A subunit family amidase
MARQLSPVEVMQAVLDQVERWEPQLHATYLLRPEAALEQARASEAAGSARAAGLLDGVPAPQGQHRHRRRPHAAGHGRHRPGACRADAPPAARLREAGACCEQDHHARLRHAVLRAVELHAWRATPGT